MGFPLTDQQRAVVDDRGGCLLVAAAAGSGKTRVLVERLLDRVERDGADVDRFLVITYTKAAAAELRGRILEELGDRLRERPSDRRLRRQAALVYQTQISTIHAFCARLLRECGHLLDLPPDLRLCDEEEAGTLMLQAMDDVLEARYEDIDPEGDFALLLDTVNARRDDSRLVQIALDIYGRVQSHPHPGRWLEQQQRAFALEGVEDVGETVWGKLLLEQAGDQIDYWTGQMARAVELASEEETLSKAYAPSLSATLEGLRRAQEEMASSWDRAAEAVAAVPFPRLGAARGCQDPAAQSRVKGIRDSCKKRLDKLTELLGGTSEQLLADMRAVAPAVRGLFALVADFTKAYQEKKARKGLLDFSDLEHFAARLLTREDGSPTELAEAWSDRFIEVMVDEYQDTNEVQNAIFSALSHGGRTLFMVGDVKQSIYRFRLADPTIFLERYRTFLPREQAAEGEPRRILLTRNFRSRPQILEGVNFLFQNIMSQTFGELDYTEDEALHPGGGLDGGADGADYRLELDALDLSRAGEEGQERAPRDLMEARFTARRIRQMLEERAPVSAREGGTRPVRPGDIVILLRSPGSSLRHYAQALGELDLPWQAEEGESFLESTEVSVALSYLKIVDNPRQDVPLISVLRSPVWGFSPDLLAEIRGLAPEGDFYDALLESDRPEVAVFLEDLAYLRERAPDMSCGQLLWEIYERTDMLGVFSLMGDGETRREDLLALAEQARAFERAGHKGLYSFLHYLEQVLENGGRFRAPKAAGEADAVRILSIHRSKGLEFPVVFLCGLSKRFNREDMQRPMLFHPKLGVGPKGLDTERMVEYSTLARRAVASQLEREMMAEELRLLYVAMTRAKEKLVLVCALTKGGRDLQRLAGDAHCPVEPQALLATQSMAQWVLLPAMARPDGASLRKAAEAASVDIYTGDCGPGWDIRWVDGTGLETAPAPPAQRLEEAAPGRDGEEVSLEALTAALDQTYPYKGDVEIASKLTATQLKGRVLDEEVADGSPPQPRTRPFLRPRFAAEELGLTPAQRGTAIHAVLQSIRFDHVDTLEEIQQEIRRLVDLQLITPQQGEAVDPRRILALFRSPLGQELRESVSVQREFKFSILVPARDYYPAASDEAQVLLQGVVDCWFETLEGIVVLDFKTDRIGEADLAERVEHYRPQLEAYSRALEEATGRRVFRRILWFFALDRPVEL